MKKHRMISSLAVLALSVIMAVTVTAAEAELPPAGNPSYRVLDISEYNGTAITWSKVKPNFDIVYLRASIKQGADGVVRKDKYVTVNSTNARAEGFHVGYYHYFRPSTDSAKNIEQADFYFNTLKTLSYDCVPVIDVEELSETKNSPNLSRTQISTAVLQFVNRFEELSGIKPMIYASASRVDEFLDSRLSSCKFWVAAWYGRVPTKGNTVFSRWDMWQQAGDVYTTGVVGTVDTGVATSNVLLGSNSALQTIDSPNGTYGLKDIGVAGWALSYYDITRVDLYVDGKMYKSIPKSDFYDRQDIENAFAGKGYSDPLNSGYSFTIPQGYLGNGEHKVQAALITSKGASWSSPKYFNVNIPKDQITLDSPNGTYSGDIGVAGWALTCRDLNRVDIYVDGKKVHSILDEDFYNRGDIESVFAGSEYINLDRAGFSYTIKKGELPTGSHTVKAAYVSESGETTWSATKTINVSIPKDQIYIDSPNGTYGGDIGVAGWAITAGEVNRVDVYVDGKSIRSIMADEFYNRGDIETAFANKGYSNLDNAGFGCVIKKGTLSAGSHSVKLAFINKNGSVSWSGTKTFNVNIPSDQVYMDSPNGNYSGDIGFAGWAITAGEVNRVDVYVDGRSIRSIMATEFYNRGDIATVFANKGYSNLDNAGFGCVIKKGTLSAGSHSVRFAFINKAGGVTWTGSRTITVNVPNDQVCMDSPNGTYSGDIGFAGWAITAGEVNRVDVYVDGRSIRSIMASEFYNRGDIETVFAGKGYSNLDKAGFGCTIKKGTIGAGSHSVRFAFINKNGGVTWTSSRTINVTVPNDQVCMDSPNGTYTGDIGFGGWALTAGEVNRVDVYVDGKSIRSIMADEFYNRGDIETVFAGKGYSNLDKAGFFCTIDKGVLSKGSHTVKFAFITKSGNVTWTGSRTITVA